MTLFHILKNYLSHNVATVYSSENDNYAMKSPMKIKILKKM